MTESKRVLTKKDITKLAFRSLFLQASFNYERMQAGGWLWSMLPALKKIHKDDKKALSESMEDNLEFINTHPNLVGFLMGLLLSLEENKEDRNLIKSLKVALFAPLAGIGDAIFWFTILPIVAGISASFAMQGSIVGPLIFLAVYIGIFVLRIVWTHMGYELGTNAVEKIKTSSQSISKSASILGSTVIGGLIAAYVHITVLSEVKINKEHAVNLQTDFFDKVFPNILPLGFTLLMFYFLKKKKASPVLLIAVTFGIAILFSALGVL
ncbi:PTS galactosamine transporter subunit IID [Neobacillus sp. FSL H8-0543]|uniref:PTS galactosamine transporter subunit IID n=1 Tax=Neobacillus sp. FSL H8-0543 TaxID=2954672 RepID=UPI0031599240